jgi:hypothetical protein
MTSWIRQICLDFPAIRDFLVGSDLLSSTSKCLQEKYFINIASSCLHLDIPANKKLQIRGTGA